MSEVLAKTKSQSPPTGGGKGFWGVASQIAIPLITTIADNLLFDRRQQKQFEREDIYWQRNADYNTASSQVARLKDAGLSPNLAYGSVDSGNMSAMPNGVSPRGANIDPMTLAQVQNINAQTRNIDADTDKKREELPVIQNTAKKLVSEIGLNEIKAEEISNNIYLIQQRAEEVKSRIGLINEQKGTEQERKIQLQLQNALFDETFDEQVKNIGLQYGINYYEVQYLAKTLGSRVYGIQLDNRIKETQKHLNEEMKNFYDAMGDYYGNLATNMGFQIDAKTETDKDGRNAYQADAEFIRFKTRNQWETTYFPMMINTLNMLVDVLKTALGAM